MLPAPIILFTFNRPAHTKRTVEALLKNSLAPDSDLYIYSDGPRTEQGQKKVTETRNYIKSITGFKNVYIAESVLNLGLAESIIRGVTEVINQRGAAIILEDDLITSPFFLQFMNDGLALYQNQPEVISIHGYSYPVKGQLPSTYFLKGADCWGWATWKRGWDLFETDGKKLLSEIESKNLKKEFNFGNSYNYFKMLQKQVNGHNSSWAIRWYASAFLLDKLSLYPGKSLVNNIGNDNTGTHSKKLRLFDTVVSEQPILTEAIPLKEVPEIKKIISSYLRKNKTKLALLGAISVIRKRIGL